MKQKYFLLTLVTILFTIYDVKSQVVDGITYQAFVVENGIEESVDFNGNIFSDKVLNVIFTILKGNVSGIIEYQETQTVNADIYGLFSCVIGHGKYTSASQNSSILNVSWGSDKHFLKVEINDKLSGEISQIQAVPYAFYTLNFHETDPKWSGLPDITANIGRIGKVSIGDTISGANLNVIGQIKINDGLQARGKVLTSDVSGLASWQIAYPKGSIVMYSGPWNFDATGKGIGTLDGWALCNGNNNTPSILNEFVMGKTNSADTLPGGTDSIQLTVAQLPVHNHSSGDSLVFNGNSLDTVPVMANGNTVWGDDWGTVTAYMLQTNQIDYGCQYPLTVDPGTPSGSITGATGYTGSINPAKVYYQPAFIKLSYIMKL